jgi:hypothetical protein
VLAWAPGQVRCWFTPGSNDPEEAFRTFSQIRDLDEAAKIFQIGGRGYQLAPLGEGGKILRFSRTDFYTGRVRKTASLSKRCVLLINIVGPATCVNCKTV